MSKAVKFIPAITLPDGSKLVTLEDAAFYVIGLPEATRKNPEWEFAGRAIVDTIEGRNLEMLASAVALSDLRVPPGNRLEALKGDRKGQHSIRINDQWRICFRWTDGAEDVEIVDYH